MDVLVINGPNLNLLGSRRPEVYGGDTLAEVEANLRTRADELGLEIEFAQDNHEGAIVDRIQAARGRVGYVVVNPGAYAHTSVAIRDAFEGTGIPFVEVHISNVYAREEFRHHSYLSAIASGIIVGCGVYGYQLALQLVAERLRD